MRGHRPQFQELTTEQLLAKAVEYWAMAADAAPGWIREEHCRIATGLQRLAVARNQDEMDPLRRPLLSKLTLEQLRGRAQANRGLAADAATDWIRDSPTASPRD